MFKRLIWFSAGAAGGAAASVYGYVRLREAKGRLAPDQVADTLVGSARSLGRGARLAGATMGTSMREAVAEGRAAMADAETRIIAELDARPPPLHHTDRPRAIESAGGRRPRAQ